MPAAYGHTVTGAAANADIGLTVRRTDTKCDLLTQVHTDGSGNGSAAALTFLKGAPISTYVGGTQTAPVATTTA
jgi:hypothetical protein